MADKFITWLEAVGKRALHIAEEAAGKIIPEAAELAQEAEPVFDLLLPVAGPVYNKVVTAVIATEQSYAQKGKQDGTGAEKLQDALGAVQGDLLPGLEGAGITGDAATTAMTNYINGIVALLKGPAISSIVNKAIPSSATGSTKPAA